MPKKFDGDQICQFWRQQALEYGQSHAASWSDRPVIEMEIGQIVDHLFHGERVLDVGCGNGYSTVRFAAKHRIQIFGLDYVSEMIKQARRRLRDLEGELLGEVEFDVGDITSLDMADESFDKVVVIRVVINQSSQEQQVQALRECSRVLKTGGLLLLSEATIQGWQALNEFRAECGLAPIPMPPFNRYLDQDQLVTTVSERLELVEIRNFASTYYVGTRVLKPLFSALLNGRPEVENPGLHWNQFFAHLPAVGDYGTQKLFIFRKK